MKISEDYAGSPCRHKKENLMPLSSVEPGRNVRIAFLDEHRGFLNKLIGMGLFPGMQITVISSNGIGPLVVDSLGARIIIGRGMAQKIFVE